MSHRARPRAADHDPTIYPESDDMGESGLELWIRIVLVPLLSRHLEERGTPQFVGGN